MLYFLVLLFGALLTLPIVSVLNETIGNSLEATKLLSGFDHTVYRDFINSADSRLQMIFAQVRFVAPFFLLLFGC